MNTLRNRIRSIVPAIFGERKLKMPVIETARIVLRKFERSDLKDIVAWEHYTDARTTDTEAQAFLDYCSGEYRQRGVGPWGMQLKATGAIVGNCGFPHVIFKSRCGEVNYYVAPRHRGQGLATEALRALLEFGFGDIGLTRIQARCDLDNLASERVMLKVGMKFEGITAISPSSKDAALPQKLYAISSTLSRLATQRT